MVVISLLAAAAFAAQPGRVIGVSGAWAAIDRGPVCEALSRSPRAASRTRAQAIVGLSFTADRSRWGQFHVRLARPVRPGASVMIDIGRHTFLLAARGSGAWGRDGAQDRAIIAALRSESTIKVSARDSGGRRFSDYFLASGAATAIDQAAARCATRDTGKIR